MQDVPKSSSAAYLILDLITKVFVQITQIRNRKRRVIFDTSKIKWIIQDHIKLRRIIYNKHNWLQKHRASCRLIRLYRTKNFVAGRMAKENGSIHDKYPKCEHKCRVKKFDAIGYRMLFNDRYWRYLYSVESSRSLAYSHGYRPQHFTIDTFSCIPFAGFLCHRSRRPLTIDYCNIYSVYDQIQIYFDEASWFVNDKQHTNTMQFLQ